MWMCQTIQQNEINIKDFNNEITETIMEIMKAITEAPIEKT